ncbi:hypothetical protein ACWD6Q_00300 [Streptomyces nigra]|uniref:hypothetical protein n=1 Tax=Streptomyces nigra TaxID=1827580 RepID=UPI003800B141
MTDTRADPAQLVTSTTEYDWWGNTAKVIETANGVTRTTTTAHDNGGRPLKSTVTGGLGATLPEVTTEYSADRGRPVKTVSTTGGTITRVFDKLGLAGQGHLEESGQDRMGRPLQHPGQTWHQDLDLWRGPGLGLERICSRHVLLLHGSQVTHRVGRPDRTT